MLATETHKELIFLRVSFLSVEFKVQLFKSVTSYNAKITILGCSELHSLRNSDVRGSGMRSTAGKLKTASFSKYGDNNTDSFF